MTKVTLALTGVDLGDGFSMDIEMEFECICHEAEKRTRDYPGCPAYIEYHPVQWRLDMAYGKNGEELISGGPWFKMDDSQFKHNTRIINEHIKKHEASIYDEICESPEMNGPTEDDIGCMHYHKMRDEGLI